MPFPRLSLTQLRQQAMADISGGTLVGIDGFLRWAILPILGWVMAQFAYLHDDFLSWMAKMAVPWSAEDEYLEGWAGLIGVTREGAVAAAFPVLFSGGEPFVAIPVGTAVTRSDGLAFTVTTEAITAIDGTAAPIVTANVAGSAGNTQAGATMTISSPIEGIISSGVAGAATVIGADAEQDPSLRTRMLQEYAQPPRGGDASDYIEWLLQIAGVTRGWVFPNGLGAGTVLLWAMLDVAEAAHGGFPQGTNGSAENEFRAATATGDQLAIANALFVKQPVTALVTVCSPVNTPLDFSITGLGALNTTANQAAIEAAIDDLLLAQGYVGGSVNPVTREPWPALEPNQIYAAISAVPGMTNFTVASPAGPVTPSTGQLFTRGTVTFAS